MKVHIFRVYNYFNIWYLYIRLEEQQMRIILTLISKSKALVLSLLLITIVFNFNAYTQQRTIALVFDDSGSMKGNPFQAVNYALQVLVGLLNPQDELYVVRMKHPQNALKIDLGRKQTEMDNVRAWQAESGTPFQSVETAMEVLKKTTSRDKWLIIFTDGRMEITQTNEDGIKDFLTNSGAKTIILNINVAENELSLAFKKLGLAKIHQSPADFKSIKEYMESIALSVMSMTQSGLSVNYTGNSAEINSVLPLKRLIVLEQDTSTKNRLLTVKKVTDNTGSPIHIEGAYYATDANQFYGKVTHITYSKDGIRVIPRGKINITFDGTADGSRFKCLPEVAAGLTARPTGGYESVRGNVYNICEEKNEINVEAELKTLDGKRLKPEILSKTRVLIHYDSSKEEMELKGSVFSKTIRVEKKLLPVSVSARFPGYFNFRTNVFFIKKIFCKKPDKLGMQSGTGYPPVKVTELDSAPFIDLIPLLNKKEVTKEQFKDLYLARIDDSDVSLEIQEADTYWKIRPKATWGIPCFTKTGKHQVVLELKSKRKDILPQEGPTTMVFEIENVSFIKKCAPFIFALILMIILLWYILGLIKKPRFCRGSEIIYQRSAKFVKNRAISYSLPGKFITRYLIPYLPETAKIEGIRFRAGRRCSYIELPKETQDEGMYISGDLLEDHGRRDYRLSIGDELLVEHRNYKETYKYSKI